MQTALPRIARRILQAGMLVGLSIITVSVLPAGRWARADEVTVVLDGAGPALPGAEPDGPAVCSVAISPNPTAGAANADLTATAGCAGGGMAIAQVEFFVGPVGTWGTGRAMEPVDGAFDSAEELVSGSISTRSLGPGEYTVSVRARDSRGSWGPLASTTLSVTLRQEVTTYGDTGGVQIPARPSAAPAPLSAAATSTAPGATVQVGQQNGGSLPERQFNAAAATLEAGELVRWVLFDNWSDQGHDIQAYDGSFASGPKSGMTTIGEAFEHTFVAPGVYTYYCRTHASLGDADPARIDERIAQGKMVGKIVVEEAPTATFAVRSQPVAFALVTVVGADQETDAAPAAWNVSDTTGAGAGWNVTLTASDFSAPDGTIAAQNMRVQLSQGAIVVVSGNTPPTTLAPSFAPLDPAVPLKLLGATTGTGMGVYDFTPEFRLTVPAETSPGTYTSSITVSLNSGP